MSKINSAAALGIAGAQASGNSSTQSIGHAAAYAQNRQTPKMSELDTELLDLKNAVTLLETQANILLDILQPVMSAQDNREKEDKGEVLQQETTSMITREIRVLTDKIQYLTRVLNVNTVL